MPITRLSSGGIIANYKCPAACGHCLYGCSPDMEPGYIDETVAARLCEKLRSMGCHSLHIGGGEPFLNIKGLIRLIKTIQANGLEIDYIETNAAWITDDDDRNRQILRDVTDVGGDCIMVSADPFHIEFIPFWKPKKLIELLKETDTPHFIWQERYLTLLGKLDPKKTYDSKALCEAVGYDVILKCAGEYGMGFNGRALNLLRKYGKKMPLPNVTEPCAELKRTSHFHVDFLGRYIPPGCTGLGILAEDLDKELDPAKYPVISRLLSGGVKCLLEYAKQRGYQPSPTGSMPDGYVSKCELCFDIRRFLIASDRQAHPDLTPESFYKQNF